MLWIGLAIVLGIAVSFSAGTLIGASLAVQGLAEDEAGLQLLVDEKKLQVLENAEARLLDREAKIDQLADMLTICEAELASVEGQLELERRLRLRAELRTND